MIPKTINTFINKFYSKRPKKDYVTTRTDIYFFDNIWSLDILDLKDYGLEKNRGHRYVLVLNEDFSNFVGQILSKSKSAKKRPPENGFITSKKKSKFF